MCRRQSRITYGRNPRSDISWRQRALVYFLTFRERPFLSGCCSRGFSCRAFFHRYFPLGSCNTGVSIADFDFSDDNRKEKEKEKKKKQKRRNARATHFLEEYASARSNTSSWLHRVHFEISATGNHRGYELCGSRWFSRNDNNPFPSEQYLNIKVGRGKNYSYVNYSYFNFLQHRFSCREIIL